MKLILRAAVAAVVLIMALGIMTSGCGGGLSVEDPSAGAAGSSASSSPVQPPPPGSAGSVTLEWDPPSTTSDGSSISDITGYKIYYGTASGVYTQILDVGNIRTYTVANIAPGTHYYAVTAYDSSATESSYSNEVSLTI